MSKTTADLIVRHAETHLVITDARTAFSRMLEASIVPALFTLAGLLVLGAVFALVHRAVEVTTPAFVSQHATEYANQVAFYAGHALSSTEEATPPRMMHGAAPALSVVSVVLLTSLSFLSGVLFFFVFLRQNSLIDVSTSAVADRIVRVAARPTSLNLHEMRTTSVSFITSSEPCSKPKFVIRPIR